MHGQQNVKKMKKKIEKSLMISKVMVVSRNWVEDPEITAE